MSRDADNRREFLKKVSLVTGSALLGAGTANRAEAKTGAKLHLATNQYPWFVYYRREKRDFNASLDSGLAGVAQSGLDGFEPIINAPGDIDRLAPLLKKHGLQMRSLYVNSTLHVPDEADKSIEQIIAIAEKAKRIGAKIIVTNPNPIAWGKSVDKDDGQLIFQAKALSRLGKELKQIGLTLAYHNHDVELRAAAREFHHMMVGTNPDYVTLCLDAHWIYRGSGNSAVAVLDVAKLYGPRITELHIRQSVENIWTESLCDGDLDYRALAAHLAGIGVTPHLVIEQSVEEATPKTIGPVEAHRRSVQYAGKVFSIFAG